MRSLPPLAIALGVLLGGCSLLAPSDEALMGGARGDGAAADGGDAGDAGDASDGGLGDDAAMDASEGGARCGQIGDCCSPGQCCAGLTCQFGTCLTCRPAGQACTPGSASTCCSGQCFAHVCQ